MPEFVRSDCEDSPKVKVLDSSDSKVVEYLFFDYVPEFKAASDEI